MYSVAEGDCSGNPFGGTGIKGFNLIPTQVRDSQISSLILSAFLLGLQSYNNNIVEPVLMATYIERPPPYIANLIILQMKRLYTNSLI